jgi:hypothetical protein
VVRAAPALRVGVRADARHLTAQFHSVKIVAALDLLHLCASPPVSSIPHDRDDTDNNQDSDAEEHLEEGLSKACRFTHRGCHEAGNIMASAVLHRFFAIDRDEALDGA